jgi:hypothetical protein
MSTTCDFGADPMSIWPCSADHGYDSHDMLGAPHSGAARRYAPRVGDLTYFKSRRSFGSAALAHTLLQVGNFRLPLLPSLLPPPARTTIWVRIKWILPRTLVINRLGEGVTVNIDKSELNWRWTRVNIRRWSSA